MKDSHSRKATEHEERKISELEPLTKEQKRAAKQMVKRIMKELNNDPEFRYARSCKFCFVASVWCFLMLIGTLLILDIFSLDSLLFMILATGLLLAYDLFSWHIEEPYRQFYLNTNHALHLLLGGIFFLILKARNPEVLLGIDRTKILIMLIFASNLVLISFQIVDSVNSQFCKRVFEKRKIDSEEFDE